MCLYFDKYNLRGTLPQTGAIEAYKVVKREKEKLRSAVYKYLWKPGWNYSSRGEDTSLSDLEQFNGRIAEGIHVFLEQQSASRYGLPNEIVVKVICHLENLVAISAARYEAVFTKVWFEKEEYQRVVPWYYRWYWRLRRLFKCA